MSETPDREQEIRARADAATPGPWVCDENGAFGHHTVVAEVRGYERIIGGFEFGTGADARADHDFTLNARTDVPWLLDRLAEKQFLFQSARDRADNLAAENTRLRDRVAELETARATATASPARADLRQQLARAIHHYDYDHALSGNDVPSEHHRGEADAVLPVVEAHTATAVRRALEEAARDVPSLSHWGTRHWLEDRAAAVASPAREPHSCDHPERCTPECRATDDCCIPAREQGEAQPGTLPAWLYQRFGQYPAGVDWDELPETDQAYWAHEASAVRRAVTRGGFKNPARAESEGGDAR